MRLRVSTVEPVLGSLITYYALPHINKKRQAKATKILYLGAMVFAYTPATNSLRASNPSLPFLVLAALLQQARRIEGTRVVAASLRQVGPVTRVVVCSPLFLCLVFSVG